MYIQASDIQDMYIQVAAFNMYTQEAGHDRMYIQNKRRGVQPHFCPSPNPDFDVSWGKMCKNGEKSIWKEREKVFVLANC